MNQINRKSVLVVGAGISGLVVGQLLSKKGFSVNLLEKSAGVGGRMATRRWESGHWNHGIPWLQPKDIPDTLLTNWSQILIEASSLEGPRYVSPEGLTQLAKLLAKDLAIHKKSRAVKVQFLIESRLWKVTDEANQDFFAHALVLTVPTPQTFELLKASELLEATGLQDFLSGIQYRPQLVGLGVNSTIALGQVEKKAGSPFEKVIESSGFISLFLDELFSSSRWDRSDEEITKEILNLAEKEKLGPFSHFELKRWRYSRCKTPSSQAFLKAADPYPLYLIGDAFSGGDISGAIHSAFKLSENFSLN